MQVPVDGVTVSGAAHVSNAHITGEALPILAQRDTELLSGALATDSWLIVRATKVAHESALARIRELTEFAKVGCQPFSVCRPLRRDLSEWLSRPWIAVLPYGFIMTLGSHRPIYVAPI